ncbi:hypothetical protein HW452_12950 [Halomonas aquamarina]|uniref:Uncharacterized protein n=1 Tax=Vreelandella aquamarina TaxID=77097 RepID=A0ACC5VWI5_9GAMM|nr:hypothetical protein [Halomonas aquamarina]MBZ5488432.1 hypothetical protein [Halomonas aquamarina]
MDDTLSNTFSLTAFQQDLASSDQRQLLRWADCELHAAFIRHAEGHEEPALIQVDESSRYIASTQADTLHNLLAGAQLEEGSEAVIRSLPLHELARNAHLFRVGLHILDGEEGLYLEGPTTLVLGTAAVVESPEGDEVIYQAEIFFFEPLDEARTLPHGTVQYWYDARPTHTQSDGQTASIYVFDDRLDWLDPLFPDLPDGARPLSTLSPDARAFFERMRLPLLKRQEKTPATPAEPDRRYHNDLIKDQVLYSFNQLRAMVDRDIVPAASGISLKVVETLRSEEETDDATMSWEIRVGFTTPLGVEAHFDPNWVSASLCQANAELPDTTGTHGASEALRERIVDHLTWMFFQQGRNFFLMRFNECLEGLLPDVIINSDKPYQPDYTDHRFPCLARFQCGEHPVPVLLLGQQDGNYVCQPLKDVDIEEKHVPTLIPRRSSLIDMTRNTMMLSSIGERWVLPTSLIDFPEYWYEGIRLSNQNLTSKFVSSMRVNTLLNEYEKGGTANSSAAKWLIAGCVAALIGVIAMMNL